MLIYQQRGRHNLNADYLNLGQYGRWQFGENEQVISDIILLEKEEKKYMYITHTHTCPF
jgi:hypothetical protein